MKYIIGTLILVFFIVIFSGGDSSDTSSQSNELPYGVANPTYKIEFTDGSRFYAEEFTRVDVKGVGGKGCVEFKTMTEYVNTSGKITKKGDTLLHCGSYTFSPPYIDTNIMDK